MQAVQVMDRAAASLKCVELPAPEVLPDTVLVKVAVAGVNFADLMQRQGIYPRVIPTPYIPGYEVAGEVMQVGSNVGGIAVGDCIAALLPTGGGFAEYALVHQRLAIPLPAGIDLAEATALLTQGLTAFVMVEKFLKADQSVLVTAAAGGVGALLVQLAVAKGASPVYGAASSDEKLAFIAKLGATAVNYRQPNWEQRVAGEGLTFDVIFDAAGGATLQQAWTLLKEFGALVIYGNASAADLTLSARQLAGPLPFSNHTLHFFGFSRCLEADPTLYRRALSTLFEAQHRGTLKIAVQHRYPLANAEQALRDVAHRKTTGKVVLIP